jgi:GPH family glycoside/pentoside/hexuronide:cation symporter
LIDYGAYNLKMDDDLLWLSGLGGGALTQAFGVRAYDFYENEVFLDAGLIFLAWVLYGIWNSINDPLGGYISDRKYGFTRRWGRRTPWIALTIGPFSLFYVLIFTPPDPTNQVSLFFWFLLTICLFDTFYTIWGLNVAAVLPEKFRSDLERNKMTSVKYIFSMFGLVLGLLVPPLFIDYGNRESFIIAAVVITVISAAALVGGIHGCRDTPEMIQDALKRAETRSEEPSFSTSIKQIARRRNARSFLLANMCFQSVQVILLASVPYYVRSVLQMGAIFETLILGITVLFIVISIPIWSRIMRRIGTRLTILATVAVGIVGLFIIILPIDLVVTMIAMAIVGFGIGGQLISQEVAYADVIDEDTVTFKIRREGMYYGVNGFMIRFSFIFQAIAFGVIHYFTNYVEGSVAQLPEAMLGIRLHFGLVPLLFNAIVLLLVWKFYDLVPAKVQQIKAQIVELKL